MFGVEIWAYCLMPNHVHLIAVPSQEPSLRLAIADTHMRYTRMINVRNGWTGCLWQGRFFSCPMDDTHLLYAVRYVEQNPVRAGICTHASDYQWSSARAHLSARDDLVVRVEPLLDRYSDWMDFLDQQDSFEQIDSIRTRCRTGRPLASENFILSLEKRFGRALKPQKRGPKATSTS